LIYLTAKSIIAARRPFDPMRTVVTIAQIAEAAGVSTATVDRVLNRRSGVNADTVDRVNAAVRQLGSSAVVRGRPRVRTYRFAYVLPALALPFFDTVDRLIAQSAGEFRHSHITELTHRLDATDPAAFAAQLAQLNDCDGIALLGPDVPAVKLAINDLVRAGVHVVTLFSDVAGAMREAFIGADNLAAGRVAGLLLARMLGPATRKRPLRVGLLSPATRFAAQIERRIGFAQALEERAPLVEVVRVTDLPETEAAARDAARVWLATLDDTRRLAGIYTVGAGTAGIAQAVAEAELATPEFGLIAHDLTESHRGLLVSGALSYVLQQDVHYGVMNAAKVLRALCEGVRGALSVVQPKVEILTAENLA
jgi:LacI family transcriptional regulator